MNWWTIAGLAYAAVALLFLYVGFARTRYPWWLIVPISLLWLPACILGWLYARWLKQ